MHASPRLPPPEARRSRAYLAALSAPPLALALASTPGVGVAAPEPPAASERTEPEGSEAAAGTSGLGGKGGRGGSGGAAGTTGLGGGGPGGAGGSAGRGGASPLQMASVANGDSAPDGAFHTFGNANADRADVHRSGIDSSEISLTYGVRARSLRAIPFAQHPQTTAQTTLRRGVQMETGSEWAPHAPLGAPVVSAPATGLMVTANGSCRDEADQVGVARNPRDHAP